MSRPSPLAVACWLVASACLAIVFFTDTGEFTRWLALAGYIGFSGVSILWPRRSPG